MLMGKCEMNNDFLVILIINFKFWILCIWKINYVNNFDKLLNFEGSWFLLFIIFLMFKKFFFKYINVFSN